MEDMNRRIVHEEIENERDDVSGALSPLWASAPIESLEDNSGYHSENNTNNEYNDEDTTNNTNAFNASKELIVGFNSCQNGVGLSIADMTIIIKIITHPEFRPSDVVFKNGKQARDLLRHLIRQTRSEEVGVSTF